MLTPVLASDSGLVACPLVAAFKLVYVSPEETLQFYAGFPAQDIRDVLEFVKGRMEAGNVARPGAPFRDALEKGYGVEIRRPSARLSRTSLTPG